MKKRFLTLEDFKDVYIKFHQRGLRFLLSKLNINQYERTNSAFNNSNLQTSNFWIIPEVKKRWNKLITGNENTIYEEYLTQNYFKDKENLKLISLGSGICSHELVIAELKPNWEIHCYDFSDELIKNAKKIAEKKGLKNIFFHAENILEFPFKPNEFDVVFFHASLHHFSDMHRFIKNIVIKNLKPEGYLVINEFVGKNRLQYSKEQISYINKAISLIPKKYRKIYKTNLYKNKYFGSGIWRMIIADPSECVDSENIIPAICENFQIIEEKPFGNNLLQSALKDIAHHFVEIDDEKKEILNQIFNLEDEFLRSHQSDCVFGIYKLKIQN